MRALGALLLMALLLLGLLAAYWAWLTWTLDQPYDEVWIALNSRLPEPLRAWSCGEMAARLGAAAGIAPLGCEGLWTPGG